MSDLRKLTTQLLANAVRAPIPTMSSRAHSALDELVRRLTEAEQERDRLRASIVAMFQEHEQACRLAREANDRVTAIINQRLPLSADADELAEARGEAP
jgi:hypothetical protein